MWHDLIKSNYAFDRFDVAIYTGGGGGGGGQKSYLKLEMLRIQSSK